MLRTSASNRQKSINGPVLLFGTVEYLAGWLRTISIGRAKKRVINAKLSAWRTIKFSFVKNCLTSVDILLLMKKKKMAAWLEREKDHGHSPHNSPPLNIRISRNSWTTYEVRGDAPMPWSACCSWQVPLGTHNLHHLTKTRCWCAIRIDWSYRIRGPCTLEYRELIDHNLQQKEKKK